LMNYKRKTGGFVSVMISFLIMAFQLFLFC